MAKLITNTNINRKTALLISGGIVLIFTSLIFASLSFIYFSFDKTLEFPVEKLVSININSSNLTSNERTELSKIKYEFVEYEEIPQNCINAVVAIEDKTFFENNGIDRNGTLRLFLNIIPGVNSSGGSTISQQVIKISRDRFYDRNPIDKTIEIIWAYRLNEEFSKEEIMEMYLNYAYFGDYNYGIQAASKSYFNKEVSELTLEECAYLGGIPQLPNVYSPTIGNKEAGERRKTRVLEEMIEEGYINN